MRQWYISRQGQIKGPFTDEQVRGLARSGKLLPEDLVSYTGASQWVPSQEVPELFPAPIPSAPLPSAPPADTTHPLLQSLLGLPKPVLFGVFGGLGGLFGALLLGELLWALLSPPTFRAQPEVRLGIPANIRVYPGGKNRLVVQIARDGFKGPVRIEADKPPTGVSLAATIIPEDQNEANIDVQVAADFPLGSQSLTVWGRAQGDPKIQDHSSTLEVKVEPVPAQLRLAVPAEIAVFQGGKNQFRIKLARHHFAGPVKLQLHGLPEGLVLADILVPEDRAEEELTLSVPESAKVGEWRVTVIGTQEDGRGKARTAEKFNLRVRPIPVPQADVVFVLDLTGSMQFAIDGVKEGIQNFASQLEASRIDARIALVGFRDIEGDRERPFVMTIQGEAFTKDYQAFRKEVQKLRALNLGNDDIPESSLQGLALAAGQPFRPNTSRVLLLITDAPPKIHLRETPSTVRETIDDLRQKQINQLHFVVRQEDYVQVYTRFHDTFKGTFLDLTRATSADAFSALLPKLSREISTLTIASQPRTPGEAPTLPPLPVESGSLPPPAAVAPVIKAVQSTQAYTKQDSNRLLLAIAVWTMAIAGCISLLILAGQRFYACRRWVGLLEGGKSLGGGFLAGLAGGAAGQLLFQNTAGGTTWEVVSRLLGWGLLGSLIGIGMSFFVPNLKWWRGWFGGLLGGLLGAAAFVLISVAAGSFLGRWIGAGILGFFIGLMVALAELVFRRYWLEIAFSPRECRTVTLGSTAILLGSDERQVDVAIPGSSPLALRYWLDGDRVMFQEGPQGKATELVPGGRKMLGKVAVTLCSATQARKAGCILQMSNGASYHLVEGLPLTAEDLPGLHPQGTDGIVALVSSRPNDPTALLLRNRSKEAWVLRGVDGSQKNIEPGRGLELSFAESIASISFGALQGTLRREAR